MPTRTSAVNILIDSLLPDDLKDPFRVYDKKGLDQLMTEVAKKYPEQYPRLAKQIGDIGRMQAYRRGETFTLEDFKPVIDRSLDYTELEAEEEVLRQRISDPDELRSALAELYGRFSDRITKKTNQAALARRNNIALTVLTGARGKEPQLRDLVSTPGFYPDASGGVVPWFIRKSFAEGMRPADYLAGTYAARAAVTESKRATAQGGFLAKTLSRAAATFTVSSPDCGTTNGVDLTLDEPDIRGRVLQRDTAGFPTGTVIDRKVMAALKAKKLDRVIVRSPMTCGAENGICSRCYGVKSEGRFPKVGEHIGITAATAFGEPLTQAALCLAAGTEVRMADSSIKKIEEIQAGEWVMGADKNGNTFPVEVTALHDQGLQDCRRYGFAVGSTTEMLYLTATPEHKMLVHKKTTSPHNFRKYQGAYGYGGPDNDRAIVLPVGHPSKNIAAVLSVSCSVGGVSEPLAIRKTDESAGRIHCYDITVNHEDHLFVLANGLIVSNSMKHVVSGKGGKKEFSGLNYIQQFVESPEEFKDRSVVAKKEGRVERIEPAPQGGNYVYVAGERHYVPLDRSVEVSIGDELEAGDSITDGLVDVEDILQYKGLGEARKYWVDRLSEMAKASSAAMDRRHFEVLARANVDHIQLDDPVEEGFLPDDVTRYSQFMQKRQINKPPKEYRLKDSVGKWLEQPALHHTVGTKITPKIAKHLEENGFEKVFVSEEEPSFRPQFVRLQQVAATSDDWLASLGGSYLGNQLQQGITRAQDTNIESNIHPVPRLAVGVDYGKDIERTGKF